MSSVLPVRRAPTVAVVAVLGVASLGGAQITMAGAAGAAVTPALVTSASANPPVVGGPGASVVITGSVTDAETCQLVLLSAQSFPVVFSHGPRDCRSGRFSARATVGPNSTTLPRLVAFGLVARNASSSYLGRFFVRIGAMPPATVLSASATPVSIPSGGATVAIAATVAHAIWCQLDLLSRQSFPVVFSHNPRRCSGGAILARVTIGPNPTTVPRTVAFSVVASNSASSFEGRFYVTMAAAKHSSPVTPGPAPPTTPPSTPPGAPQTSGVPPATIVPGPSQSTPVDTQAASNWSGWAAGGGPFNVAKGTFTLPDSVAGTPGGSQVSEWVGLDGLNDADSSLIQAGVDAVPDPTNPQGFDLQPWWEILPAQETDITSVSVSPGDSVTVTIWQVKGTSWEINLTDNTNGQSFTSPPQTYTGPATSAEWIVEATTVCQPSCSTTSLASYQPAIAFSGIGMSGASPTSLYQIEMVQGGQTVSAPTELSGGSFSVDYTGPSYSPT